MKPQVIILLLLLGGATLLRAADYTLIEKLPQRVTAEKAKDQAGWDSGVTATMKEAAYHYNDALTAMIKELAAAYYPKDFFTDDLEVDTYVKALYMTGRFHEAVGNPSGEAQGTVSALDVPSAVSTELEETVADMVAAITADEKGFNGKAWKKKWEAAVK